MPTVAEQLRRAREEQKLTVYQVAEVTKIRTDHIRALEDGNYNVFSAPVYIRGFVRTCATVLKLDVSAIMGTLDGELARTDKFREPPSLAGESRGWVDYLMLQLSRNWRIALPLLVAMVAVAIVAVSYRTWRSYKAKDPLANLRPGLYQPASNTSADVLPLPANPPKK